MRFKDFKDVVLESLQRLQDAQATLFSVYVPVQDHPAYMIAVYCDYGLFSGEANKQSIERSDINVELLLDGQPYTGALKQLPTSIVAAYAQALTVVDRWVDAEIDDLQLPPV